MKLSDRIYTLRKKKGMTQDELATYCKVSRQAVSKWETTDAKPDIDSIVKLAKLFDMSVDEFINESLSHNKTSTKYHKKSIVVGVVVGFIFGALITSFILSVTKKEDTPINIQPTVEIVDCNFKALSNGMFSIELFINEENVDSLSLNINALRYDYTNQENLFYNEEKMCYYTEFILNKNVDYDIYLVINNSRQIALYDHVRVEENKYNNNYNDVYYNEKYK